MITAYDGGVMTGNGTYFFHVNARSFIAGITSLMIEMGDEIIKDIACFLDFQLGPYGETFVPAAVIPRK